MIALGILLASCSSAFALNPSLDISQYAHTAWKVRDGFANGQIASIAQTPDGYIWLGEEFGLFRFDGVHPLLWRPPGNQHLPPGTIRSLLVSRDGTLWIGAKGLASWKDGKLTEYPRFADQFVFALLEDHEGTIWVGTAALPSGKLCAIRSDTIHCYGDDGSFGRFVNALHEDSHGNLWVAVQHGLWRWKPGLQKFYSLPGGSEGIQAVAEDTDGSLLAGWQGGIYRFADGKTQTYPLPGFTRKFGARRMFRDRDGGLWIVTLNHGLLHLHQGRTDVFAQSDGLSSDTVYDVLEDREGNIWVTTINGLDQFHELSAATVTVKQGLSKDLVGSVLADTTGVVWLATYGGLNRWEHGQIKTYRLGTGKLNDLPESLFQDDRGRIWVSTVRGIGYLDSDKFIPISGIPSGNNLSISQDKAGNLWLANEHLGLFRVSSEGNVRQISWTALGHEDHASVLAADPARGGLWIGFFLGGIAYFSDGQIRTSYTAVDGLGAGRVSDFKVDTDGTLWISTEGGLSRLKDNHVATLTSKNGLPCDTVHWTVEDDDRSYWLYTACGLVRIARSDLAAWVAAVDKRQYKDVQVRVTLFDSSDGIRSLSTPSHYHPQVAKTPDGKLWFLPWDGVSVIDPRHIPVNKLPPPVHIEQIVADGKTYDLSRGLRLPPRARNLAIDYTALSFVAPEKIHFRYKLEGQDPDWREVINDREVQYSNLAPGNYHFRVMACNNSGVWNEAGATLDFSIAPAYYQTVWFQALCVVAFFAFLWWVYQLRKRQLQQQFNMRLETRVNERTRIARELHDTLLQSFHGLLFRFQAARNMLPRRPEEAGQALDGAILRAEQAITEGRSAIHDLRSAADEQPDLPQSLTEIGRELSTANGDHDSPLFHVVVEGERRKLSRAFQSEVYRIARELLQNAFQHAGAREIEAEVRYEPRMFRLLVRDDGKGIDPNVLEQGGRPGHWGLPGIRERAEQIGAEVDFWSEAGAGTEIQLNIPAGIAYEKSQDGSGFQLFRKKKSHEHHS